MDFEKWSLEGRNDIEMVENNWELWEPVMSLYLSQQKKILSLSDC